MWEIVLPKLLDLTLFSPFFIVLGWYVWELHKARNIALDRIDAVQNTRVEEAKAVTTRLVELNDKWHGSVHETMTSINGTLDAHKRAWSEVKSLLKDLREQGDNDRKAGK